MWPSRESQSHRAMFEASSASCRRFLLIESSRANGAILRYSRATPARSSTVNTRTATCNCVVVSRGLVDHRGRAQTLQLYIPNRTFLRLLPVAREQYEVSALTNHEGRFVAQSSIVWNKARPAWPPPHNCCAKPIDLSPTSRSTVVSMITAPSPGAFVRRQEPLPPSSAPA